MAPKIAQAIAIPAAAPLDNVAPLCGIRVAVADPVAGKTSAEDGSPLDVALTALDCLTSGLPVVRLVEEDEYRLDEVFDDLEVKDRAKDVAKGTLFESVNVTPYTNSERPPVVKELKRLAVGGVVGVLVPKTRVYSVMSITVVDICSSSSSEDIAYSQRRLVGHFKEEIKPK